MPSATGDDGERPVGGGDEPPGESDALRLIGVGERGAAATEHGGQFPRKVDRVADAGVHALATDRAVDVGGVAQQERAPRLEPVGDAVVYAIRREPVHTLN